MDMGAEVPIPITEDIVCLLTHVFNLNWEILVQTPWMVMFKDTYDCKKQSGEKLCHSSDLILTRIDAELRLLENMKRCLGLRVKADREYAISLNSFVLQAAKMDSVELAGSLVAKAWAGMATNS